LHGTAECPYTSQWDAPFPLKIASSHGSGPPCNTWFFGPARAHNRNCISIGSAVLQSSLVCQTDRQTDHATRSVIVGCIYLHSTAMRPNDRRQWSLQFETIRRQRRLATTRNIKMCLLTSAWHSVWRVHRVVGITCQRRRYDGFTLRHSFWRSSAFGTHSANFDAASHLATRRGMSR